MPELPKDHFQTRQGKTIALKPWTFDTLSEYAADLKRFVDAMTAVAMGEEGDETDARLKAIAAALPALRASVQDPDSLAHVQGLSEQVALIEAVWDFNEMGDGLGKAMSLGAKMSGGILKGAGLNLSETPGATGI